LDYYFCENEESDHYWDWYCSHRLYQRMLTGWLPPILVSLWQNMIMPNGLYYLVQATARCASFSQLEMSIADKFFLWDVLNIYLGGMLGGSILNHIDAIVKKPADAVHIIGKALPVSSNFFVNYVTLRAFFLAPLQLLIPHGGVWQFLLR